MNITTRLAPSFRRQGRVATALCLLAAALAACGGAPDDIELPALQVAVARVDDAPARVRLQGCVVDEWFIPRSGTVVRLRGADGRLLGHATSDNDGRFSLQVPSNQAISFNVDKDGGEVQRVAAAQGDVAVTTCLMDAQN